MLEIILSACDLVRLSNCASFSLTYKEKEQSAGLELDSCTGSFNTLIQVVNSSCLLSSIDFLLCLAELGF